jgi:hypothetical protein
LCAGAAGALTLVAALALPLLAWPLPPGLTLGLTARGAGPRREGRATKRGTAAGVREFAPELLRAPLPRCSRPGAPSWSIAAAGGVRRGQGQGSAGPGARGAPAEDVRG